jgi:hypothetical protein
VWGDKLKHPKQGEVVKEERRQGKKPSKVSSSQRNISSILKINTSYIFKYKIIITQGSRRTLRIHWHVYCTFGISSIEE